MNNLGIYQTFFIGFIVISSINYIVFCNILAFIPLLLICCIINVLFYMHINTFNMAAKYLKSED